MCYVSMLTIIWVQLLMGAICSHILLQTSPTVPFTLSSSLQDPNQNGHVLYLKKNHVTKTEQILQKFLPPLDTFPMNRKYVMSCE